MTSTTTEHHQQCHGQCSIAKTGRKALFAALTIASSTSLIATEAFQPPVVSPSVGSPRAVTSTKLNYVVSGGDQSTSDNTGIQKIKGSKTKKVKTIKTKKVADTKYKHGYMVANHDDERSFWLHALQNLKSKTLESEQSLWTRIACAYGPSELRESCKDAFLVRVGDTDLDIALFVPSDSTVGTKNVVSATQESRRNRQLVTIRVGFPEGSSFDKDAFTFEDELSAVIRQVRLLEQKANDKLSKSHGEE